MMMDAIHSLYLWRSLRFPPAIEQRFQQFYSARYRRQMRLGLIICVAGLYAVLIFHALFSPEFLLLHSLLRFGSLFVLTLLLVLARSQWMRRWHQPILLCATLTAVIHVLSIASVAPQALRYTAFSGVFVVALAAAAMLRMQFRYALVFCSIYPLACIAWSLWMNEVTRVVLGQAMLLLVGNVMALTNNWLMEFGARRSYVQLRLLTLEKAETKSANTRLKQLLDRDALTGIANRRHFDESLSSEWRRARRNQTPLSLLMIDVDHFKNYNDHYGHQAGDQCLRDLAQELAHCFQRSGEILARYGGEEFVVVLPGSTAEEAQHAAEVARHAIQQRVLPHAASPVAPVVTISIGAATVIPGADNSPEAMVAAADRALYAAKHAGRNRVIHAAQLNEHD